MPGPSKRNVGMRMKMAIAMLCVAVVAVLATLAVYQLLRWILGLQVNGAEELGPAQAAEDVRLEDEKRRLLNHLREIRFDFETGKLDVNDYTSLRERYEAEAELILTAMDARKQLRLDGPLGDA